MSDQVEEWGRLLMPFMNPDNLRTCPTVAEHQVAKSAAKARKLGSLKRWFAAKGLSGCGPKLDKMVKGWMW